LTGKENNDITTSKNKVHIKGTNIITEARMNKSVTFKTALALFSKQIIKCNASN
jgi:hypothetical protein